MEPTARSPISWCGSIKRDQTEQPVFFAANSGGKKDSGGRGKKVPQTVKTQGSSVGLTDRAEKGSGHRVEIVDPAVAEISDPKHATHEGKAPRRIEIAIGDQAPDQDSTG